MEYVINIAQRDGDYADGAPRFRHFARVEVPGGEAEARIRYAEFLTRFPEAEGFGLSLTAWIKSGKELHRSPARDRL